MGKAETSTCARCRAMKIRCNGKNPCDPCSRARIEVTCNYTNTPTTVHGSELRKGAACTACRRKKKKCSGDWPCRTCVAARKEDDCKFDDDSQFALTRSLIERTRQLEKLLHQAKQMPPNTLDHQLSPEVLIELDQLDSTSELAAPLTIREDAEVVASNNDAGPSDPTFLMPDSFDLLPLTLVRDTVGNPNLGDSLDVVSNLGVTPESEEDKLLRLRALFLETAPQHGFSLSLKKLDAIRKGDMTGLVVHPVLVHVCHLWGYLLDFLSRSRIVVGFEIEEESTQMDLIQASLNGVFGPAPTPTTSILTYLALSIYFQKKVQLERGQEYLVAASKTALEHDIDLACLGNISSDEINPGFSAFPINDADEMRAVFSHLIYVGTSLHLTVNGMIPQVVDARLLDKFSVLMNTQVATHVDVNFMRAKSIRLFAETRQLTSTWNGSPLGSTAPTLWFDQYWKLIEQIHSHIGVLQPAVLKLSFLPDYHTTELVLQLSTILALAALADLHATFAPGHPESSRRYRDTLTEIVSISGTFTSNDFRFLAPILSLCWTVATQGILENRIVYENQNSIITTIRQCNQNLK
ncbi:hypothetical protein C8J57DRAFT_409209 [Mycena rebaudengoi]|nr:hypothetical protein C8J57DRAFT_409209 [Mycena rebaudengoi]